MNIDELIEAKAKVKEEKFSLNAQLKELNKTESSLDYQLLDQLDEQGLSRTANDKASVSINKDIVPEVTDWDAFYADVLEQRDFSLLQKRVSASAYKERLKLCESIPGLQPREIRRINFRSL